MAENKLLDDIKNSIMDMQSQMQNTYSNLNDLKISGESHDHTVKVTMTATYGFVDLEFDERALKGGVKEFKWRVREAWKNVTEEIQKTTQAKTVELLQGMYIPDDIKNININSGAQKQLLSNELTDNDALKDFAADISKFKEEEK